MTALLWATAKTAGEVPPGAIASAEFTTERPFCVHDLLVSPMTRQSFELLGLDVNGVPFLAAEKVARPMSLDEFADAVSGKLVVGFKFAAPNGKGRGFFRVRNRTKEPKAFLVGLIGPEEV